MSRRKRDDAGDAGGIVEVGPVGRWRSSIDRTRRLSLYLRMREGERVRIEGYRGAILRCDDEPTKA